MSSFIPFSRFPSESSRMIPDESGRRKRLRRETQPKTEEEEEATPIEACRSLAARDSSRTRATIRDGDRVYARPGAESATVAIPGGGIPVDKDYHEGMTPLSRLALPAAFGPSLDSVTLRSVRERAIYHAVLLSIPLLSPLPFIVAVPCCLSAARVYAVLRA